MPILQFFFYDLFTVVWTVVRFTDDDELLVLQGHDLVQYGADDLKIEAGASCLGQWCNGQLYEAVIVTIHGKEIEYLGAVS